MTGQPASETATLNKPLITDSDGLGPQFWHGKKAFLNDNLLKEHTGILRTMLGIDSWKLNTFLGVKGPMDKISCLSIQIQNALFNIWV